MNTDFANELPNQSKKTLAQWNERLPPAFFISVYPCSSVVELNGDGFMPLSGQS